MNMLRSCLFTLVFYAGSLFLLFIAYRIFIYLFLYEGEMKFIKWRLNSIPNAEVVNIGGHKDVTLEHICARIKVGDTGEIVLADLNWRDRTYPERVLVVSIGGYSFKTIGCHKGYGPSGGYGPGVGNGLDIGTASPMGRQIGLEFRSARDVIENYDRILEHVERLKLAPEWNAIRTTEYEAFLFKMEARSPDRDTIYDLFGVDRMAGFARTLPWTRDCGSPQAASGS